MPQFHDHFEGPYYQSRAHRNRRLEAFTVNFDIIPRTSLHSGHVAVKNEDQSAWMIPVKSWDVCRWLVNEAPRNPVRIWWVETRKYYDDPLVKLRKNIRNLAYSSVCFLKWNVTSIVREGKSREIQNRKYDGFGLRENEDMQVKHKIWMFINWILHLCSRR